MLLLLLLMLLMSLLLLMLLMLLMLLVADDAGGADGDDDVADDDAAGEAADDGADRDAECAPKRSQVIASDQSRILNMIPRDPFRILNKSERSQAIQRDPQLSQATPSNLKRSKRSEAIRSNFS